MAKTQYYGMKYPFTYDNLDLTHVDLNDTFEDSIKSQILHIIFTPKGQRLRDPSFGSGLVAYIFEQGDASTFEAIKTQLRGDINSRIPNVSLDNIEILDGGDDHSKIVSIYYTVQKGNTEVQNNIAVKI